MSFQRTRYTCLKSFHDFPCSHRQWKHPGHCRFVHGYSRSFSFWFASERLDNNGFVVDFSSLKLLEEKLKEQFDHTFLINVDDPLISDWQKLHDAGALNLRIMENVGMESSSKLIWNWANSLLLDVDKGRSCCFRTESRENEHNSAFYEKFPSWFETSSKTVS